MFFITCTAAPICPTKTDTQIKMDALKAEKDVLMKQVIESKDGLIEAQKARIQELEAKVDALALS